MRAIVYDDFGPPEAMTLRTIDIPEPGPGQVRVRMRCASVNPADWKTREGWYRGRADYPYTLPLIPGADGSGVVESVGAGVHRFRGGEDVVVWAPQRLGRWGSYAEYVSVDEDAVALKPVNLSFAEAATFPSAGMTAWQVLTFPELGDVQPGARVFVHGGSGGVGSFGTQFARARGARVVATCGSDNVGYVRGLGAERVIDYRREDVATAVRAFAPDGLDVILDAVGEGTLPAAMSLLRPGGIWLRLRTISPNDAKGPDDAEQRDHDVRAPLVSLRRSTVAADFDEVRTLVEMNLVGPPEIEILPLSAAADAHRRVQAGHVRGKLVLTINA